MVSRFLNLEWKSFIRSMFWQKGVLINIVMAFFVLYFIIIFSGIGIGGYYILKEELPTKDPLDIINSLLLFYFIGDLIIRYLMQKLPVMNIKPMLHLPIKKKKLVHYILTKSVFSFFNIIGLFFYIPFAIVLMKEGYGISNVIGWLIGLFSITIVANYTNFLINKNNIALVILATILISAITLQTYNIYNLQHLSSYLFNGLYENPIGFILPIIVVGILYFLNFKQLDTKVYLDNAVTIKAKQVSSTDLSFIDKFGSLAPFLKNDMRLIWRNKRPKNVFFMSFIFIFYAVYFFTNEIYHEKMPSFLIFAALFVTGGFVINFGQFIPAWDSSYYRMIMSQNIQYRNFLESKWLLMVAMTFVLYILSIPYIYFGIDKFLMISAGAIFNIGFNSLFILFAGSFNRKSIDLSRGGFGNTQGMSTSQFLIIIPMMGIPMLLFWVLDTYVSFNAGVIAIACVGIISLIFKNYFMNLIEKKYIKDKYATIHAFNQTH